MATGKEWMKEMKKVELMDLQIYRDALAQLMSWGMFRDEYGWTGLIPVTNLLDTEIAERLKD